MLWNQSYIKSVHQRQKTCRTTTAPILDIIVPPTLAEIDKEAIASKPVTGGKLFC